MGRHRGGQMKLLLLSAIALYLMTACTMFTAWRSIPAPGGCEECHKVPISSNWQLSYRPATLTDERSQETFQRPESMITKGDKPETPLDKKKVEQLPCFDCHNAPDDRHKQRKGKFHH